MSNFKILMSDRYKVVLLGNPAVGKTTMASCLVGKDISTNYTPTIGAGYFGKEEIFDGKFYYFDIWDTAGQELYRALVPQYARGAHGAIIVVDFTDVKTLDTVDEWFDYLRDQGTSCKIILFCNKVDCTEKQDIQECDVKRVAEAHGVPYYLGSALTGSQVEEAFFSLTNDIVHNEFATIKTIQDVQIVEKTESKCKC